MQKHTDRRDVESDLAKTQRHILDLRLKIDQVKEEKRDLIRKRLKELEKEKEEWQAKLAAIV